MKKRKRKLKKKFIILPILICVGVGTCFGINYLNSNNTKENNQNIKQDKISKEDKEIIDKIKKEYSLNFEVPSKYVEFFKKYSEVVEKNENISDYKKYVYNLFQVITSKNAQKYLNEEFFLNRLSDLTIKIDTSLEDNWAGGIYYDESI